MLSSPRSTLFVTRFPPDPRGFGGAQRAWHVLQALLLQGQVDLVVIYRAGDTDVENADIDAAGLGVRFYLKFKVKGWESPLSRWPSLPYKLGTALELISPYCSEAPRLPSKTLVYFASLLPSKKYDLVVAGRLPSATLLSRMERMGLLEVGARILEMDDVLSQYKKVWIEEEYKNIGRFRTWQWKVDARRIAAAEREMLKKWDAVSVCTLEDVERLQESISSANVFLVPNIVDRTRLDTDHGPIRILFVGSLTSQPNIHGLKRFLDEAWPSVRAALPEAIFDVVGMHPFTGLRERLEAEGGQLHANVADVAPFYETATVVVSPIFFGSGTRIKVIEAMAFGRAIVASTLGAEGLGIENGRHALIADDMQKFAGGVIRLCRDSNLRQSLVEAAYQLQQERYGPTALREALYRMIDSLVAVKQLR
jgi:glycosyltransferase involved in cell wall biosynthesis